jgi:hypothetical protein
MSPNRWSLISVLNIENKKNFDIWTKVDVLFDVSLFDYAYTKKSLNQESPISKALLQEVYISKDCLRNRAVQYKIRYY